jgi:hypothetical protein
MFAIPRLFAEDHVGAKPGGAVGPAAISNLKISELKFRGHVTAAKNPLPSTPP